MMKRLLTGLWLLAAFVLLGACTDDDGFSRAPGLLLDFSTDTIRLDTCFSTIPTPARSMWVYNRSGEGIRLQSVRLESGNQSGFRVNVDGIYLGAQTGWQTNQVEVRRGDSIRVFVELTSTMNYKDEPTLLKDNLIFELENGNTQRVCLTTYTWDALIWRDRHIEGEETIDTRKPIVVYGGLCVDSAATLHISAGTTLYFHNDAGIDVYGRLLVEGTPEENVTLRGDRIDHMFDYLPYDRLSGQWQGIHLHASSYDNLLLYADIHGAYNGVVCDSSDVDRRKLTVEASTIHNCQGYGLLTMNSNVAVINSQLSNTQGDCLAVAGGKAEVNHCTLAQFYPFDANRGVALRFTADEWPLEGFDCRNSLITGYADDEMMGQPGDSATIFKFAFDHCIIRTPAVETDDSVYFANVAYEDPEDTLTTGRKHFATFDTYNFRLDSLSTAIDQADPATSLPLDRNGKTRDERPDIGAYEYEKANQAEPNTAPRKR